MSFLQIATIFSLGVALFLLFVAFSLQAKLEKLRSDVEALLNEQKERQEQTADLAAKNRELMKQLNEKQNVSRETSYNKSYGLPEVVDWVNQNYPTGGDK